MAHPKGLLIERLTKLGLGKPDFQTKATGPDHEPTFLSDVVVGGEVYGTGQGATKRDAERLAAEEALNFLETRPAEAPDEKSDEAPDAPDALGDEPFEGPWPVFERVLAASLEVAHDRVDPELAGDAARREVRDFALRLYKELLEDLGEVVEEDEE